MGSDASEVAIDVNALALFVVFLSCPVCACEVGVKKVDLDQPRRET